MPGWQPSCSLATLRDRAAMLRDIRAFFAARDVLEVETPALGRQTVTDPALDSFETAGRWLQTSPEHHMKRLLAAGAPSIYRLGPVFRAGEAGRWHNAEFTMLEWYRLGFDAEALMAEVAALVDALLGEAAYRRRTCAAILEARFGSPCATAAEAEAKARHLGLATGGPEDAADLLLAEALAAQPGRCFVTEFPARMAALAALDANGTAARFELLVDGIEIANGYRELRDPAELARRMAADNARRAKHGRPPVAPDDALVAAHEHGLPACAGVSVGVDRLLALQLGLPSVAAAMAFDWERA